MCLKMHGGGERKTDLPKRRGMQPLRSATACSSRSSPWVAPLHNASAIWASWYCEECRMPSRNSATSTRSAADDDGCEDIRAFSLTRSAFAALMK